MDSGGAVSLRSGVARLLSDPAAFAQVVGVDWTDLAREGVPAVVQDVRGHLVGAGSGIAVGASTIQVPLDATVAGASWNDSAVLSFGLPAELDDGGGNCKPGLLAMWLQVLDGSLDASDYHVTVGLSAAPTGGIHFNSAGTIQTAGTLSGGAQVGAGTAVASAGRDAFAAFVVGGGTVGMTAGLVQAGGGVSTPVSQGQGGHAAGSDALTLVIGAWAAATVTLNARVRWLHLGL